MESGLTKNRIISELTRSEHGDLNKYLSVGKPAAIQEPEFFAHLIAWDAKNGQIRDSHVALPMITLALPSFPNDYLENSLAHIASLRPRDFLRAFRFGEELKLKSRVRKSLMSLTSQYLRNLEVKRSIWDRTAVQHRRTLKELYALSYTKPSARAQRVLFKGNYPPGSIFEKISRLKDMSAIEAAGTIMEERIPFLVAMGALGAKAKELDLVLALLDRMSPTEIVTNARSFGKLCGNSEAAKAAFDKALEKASKSKKTSLKATRAAEAIEDETVKAKLQGVQEKQLQTLGSVDGNWVVLADKSGSMEQSIETAREVAALLAKMVRGQVSLIFFDTNPRSFDVTGKTYDKIKELTRGVTAGGGTSIGCGLQSAMDYKLDCDGIAIVSDAKENNAPYFWNVYDKFSTAVGKEVPVYLYRCKAEMVGMGDEDLAKQAQLRHQDLQEFNLGTGVDFYSLPNLVATMRTNRYSLADEIFATPLLTLKDVLKEDANVNYPIEVV